MEPDLGGLDTGGHPGRLVNLVLSKNKITRNIPQDNLREMLPGDWQLIGVRIHLPDPRGLADT